MRLSILCFAAGVCLLQFQAMLPDPFPLALLAAAAALLPAAGFFVRRFYTGLSLAVPFALAAFLLGFCWAAAVAHVRLADALAEADEGRDIRIVGVVRKMPQRFDNGVRFDFAVEQADTRVPSLVSVAWYRAWRRERNEYESAGPTGAEGGDGGFADSPDIPRIRAGERWQLTVRLKRPHGNINPDGFDYEAWLLESGVRASGYVRQKGDNRRLDEFVPAFGTVVEHARESIRDRFQRVLAERPHAGILIALAVGDQRAIDNTQWQIFSRTGITHLMSISGLHVTMFASLAYALVGGLWRRSTRLMLALPAQRAAVAGGFLAAWGYCLLAGFAVPAQRTLYMLGVVAVALWTQRIVSPSRVLALALLAVLLLDPWAVLTAGFWLSFGAVGVLFFIGSNRLGPAHWLTEWGRAQWAVTLGTLPVLLLLFQQFSLVSPLVNAIAIPVVSFVVTPLALLAAAVPPLDFLLLPAHWITAVLMTFAAHMAELPWAVWQQHAPPVWAWLTALAGPAWLLLPRGFPARWLGLAALLPMFLATPQRPAQGEARLVVLDVGQGLAVHVQTANRDLLFDTGPLYAGEANGGNRIIVPYLRAHGVRRLDGLVVSHQDTDHSGGAEAVLDALPVGWLLSSLDYEHPLSAMPVEARACRDGQSWEWDGVRFEVLHPPASHYDAPPRKSNDLSCVLKVGNGTRSVLLPADIEAPSERTLLSSPAGRDALRADVLIAPHHGSRTSSTAEFIAAVGAGQIVFPVGYRNHYGHPKPDVVERYRRTGAALRRTDGEGALTIDLAGGQARIAGERAMHWRYWYGR